MPRFARPRPPAARVLVNRYAIILVWLAMAAVYGAIMPGRFLQTSTLQSIFDSQQALVFLALAAMLTLFVGEFDLSLASNMGLAATIVPVLAGQHGMNVWLASLIAVVAAALGGAMNAVFVVGFGVEALIVTLGSGTLLLGIASLISHQTPVEGLSASFGKIAIQDLWGLPVDFYYGIVLALVLGYILGFTPVGRHMSFVGANREVARLAGVRVNRIRCLSYVFGGAIAGVGGVLLVASVGGYDPSVSPNYLLPTFASVFLGTAVVRPGTFNPIGTLVGIYFLETGVLGLSLLGYTGWVQNVFYGGALIVAVTVATVIRRRSVT